jgi:hypothetical protein
MVNVNIRSDIDAAAARLSSTFGSKREINKLPEVLWEGETVEMLAAGMYGGGMGLVAMTDMRLVFLKHGIMSQTVEDFPYSKISSVQWQANMLTGTLTVFASGNKAEIGSMQKPDGKAMADKLRAKLAQDAAPAGPAAPVAPAEAPASDIAGRLETLDKLRAVGAITDAEYQDRRAKILDSL